jgi:hypothetical protein
LLSPRPLWRIAALNGLPGQEMPDNPFLYAISGTKAGAFQLFGAET